ncbi:hypothetical protein TWF788_001195 [Orbilia oligospora]|uniref:Uncharacterized protein n=1 Tax=Orbilia oligospora TaxID=2813651 RepID=A0A7C8PA70_ORBOL|nr:hypothetical protein TWF788_001195 [Orbilia oligospora]
MPPWGGLFNSKKDNASDGSISPTPNSKREKRKEKQSISGHGMGNLREYTSHDDPRMYHLRNGVDPRSNGRFIDMHGMGFSSREEPEFIRSRLMGQFQSSLNTAVTDSIRKACIHWDDEVLHLENSYQSVLEERNGLKTENKNLANRVKLLEAEVNNKVALLREFQSGHLKTAGSRKLAPSSSAISTEYEGLERRIKDTVFARLARLDIKDPYIETLLHHQPFLEAVKGIMVDATEAQEAENVPLNLLEVVEEAEKKGLLMWMIQGVVHDILHKKIMKIHMPGLNIEELQVMEKIFNIIALSEDGQGMRSAQEWRADTYRRLAYWAENVEELGKYIEAAPAISEMSQIFGDLIDGTEKEITRILEPLCDQSPEGNNFSRLVVDIVDRAFQFSILIGSQTARYELHRDLDHTDDFKAVPDHLDESASAANNSNVSLFYGVPALVKTSSEDGEAYDVSELLVHGKIYVLFGFGDSIEEEEQRVAPPEVPEKIPIQMASPVNGGDIDSHDTEAITKAKTSQRTVAETPDETKAEPKSIATDSSTKPSGADTLPSESNPNMTESNDQPPKHEPNGATVTTTSNSSENELSKETLDTPNSPSVPGAEDILHQETSTQTDQVITDPGNLKPRPQATQKSLTELLESSPNNDHQSPERKFQNLGAHLTEIPVSPSLPKPPSIPEQTALLPQEVPVVTLELQCPDPALVKAETVPPQVQVENSTLPASHTASEATEAEETPRPQVLVEIQREPSPESLTSSIPQKQDLALRKEPEQQPSSQLTNNNNETSLVQSTPRTLPPELINLNSSSDSSKAPVVATTQKQEGVGIETLG